MKKRIICGLLFAIMITAVPVHAEAGTPAWAKKGKVAHACGGIKNYKYVNSEPSLKNAIKKGSRAIEIDFAWTSDRKLVCAHKSSDFKKGRPSLKTWQTKLLRGRYKTMTAQTALTLMAKSGRYLIVDTQESNAVAVYKEIKRQLTKMGRRSYMKKVVPQIYSKAQYKQFRAVYKFPAGIFALYKVKPWMSEQLIDIARFCQSRRLAVALHKNLLTTGRKAILKKYAVPVAVYSVNAKKEFKKLRRQGVIVFTDFLM